MRDPKQVVKLKKDCATAWAEAFKYNQSLIHVDIGHNSLKQKEMDVIAEGLKLNHTILGMHLQGNEAQVDSEGFLVNRQQNEREGKEMIAKNQILSRISP